MSDDLKWMNRHAVLLREPQWRGIATRENYRIRADLRPLFDAHPDSQELLDALAEKGLYREGCEFIARMTHRRAAVWWGYCCLLNLLEERVAIAKGTMKKASALGDLEPLMKEVEALSGIKIPSGGGLSPASIDDFCKGPQVDLKKLLAFPERPPQDRSALAASTAALRAKADKLRSFVPPGIRQAYAASMEKVEAQARGKFGFGLQEHFQKALAGVDAGRVTYKVDRFNHPTRKALFELPEKLEASRKNTIQQVKEAMPDTYPATPEAAILLKAETRMKSGNALQAVWRWIVSPDERNTTLAMQAGNEFAVKPEGLLSYVAAWSFGDLAPEGKQTVPVPPELPGTGLVSALLMMALDQDGYRKMGERYETYFNLGMDVVFGKNLWPDAVSERDAPHVGLLQELAQAEDGRAQ